MTKLSDLKNKNGIRKGQTKPSLAHLTHNFGKPKAHRNEFLENLGKPHLDSFDNLINNGLNLITKNLSPMRMELPNGDHVSVSISDFTLEYPQKDNKHIYPSECRQTGSTYSGTLHGVLNWCINEAAPIAIKNDFGELPIMVKSDRCPLKGLSPVQLIERNEHEDEWGGYFIAAGHERVLRMLLSVRRNYPLAVCRKSWMKRCHMFSDKGILLRSVAEDETSANNVLHFATDGTAKLMLAYRRNIYYVPLCLVLKCLLNVTDFYIFKRLVQGYEEDMYYKSCVQNMLRIVHIEGLSTYRDIKNFFGKIFRVRYQDQFSMISDAEICDLILRNHVAVHLKRKEDKFNLLIFMTQKLFSFVQNKCCTEGTDALMFQEVLTGGSIYQQVLKDKLEGYLANLKIEISRKTSSGKEFVLDLAEMAAISHRAGNVGNHMKNFIRTGNVIIRFSSGLPQDNGLSVTAENINRMRYMSYFKSIHRGSYFATVRSSAPRALLPDSWGFLCPVHTPDGAPCGLLNHLTKDCQVSTVPDEELVKAIPDILFDLGVVPVDDFIILKSSYSVLLDGRVVGFLHENHAPVVACALRKLKVEGKLPETTEIVLLPKKGNNSQFSGLFLFTGAGRLIRPVKNLIVNKTEFIGTFEQVYMDICIKLSEAYPNKTTHQELSATSFLSNLASLIPMPDCNQSPRNIYQCQMGKQSMGTPCHTWHVQAETKLYRLLFPSSPLFRPAHYDDIELDNFPMGINAVVAVISYTGYDMEDAVIINKSSYERGFGHGSILKSEFIELPKDSYFELDPTKPFLGPYLDEDGLIQIGCFVEEGVPLCCYFDKTELKYVIRKCHFKEPGYVDNVRLFENVTGGKGACITFRIPRNPTVGDKFASRAGQKGICSQFWPVEDLPFTDSGIVPDIIFNPHGFPSRMTIAMMIELMAGKSAALEGNVYDASPFQFSEDNTAINYFGSMLEAAGYSYYGTEKMYSGTNGRNMDADIFFGIVYYQRLRHMVLDKWQVRSTGPMDAVTLQPVHGRRRGGGIRVGEMERDALLSYGASALITDRLLNCSDKFKTLVCRKCNCLLSTSIEICRKSGGKKKVCKKCIDGGDICTIEIPYILRFLLVQLAAFNIDIRAIIK